METEKTEERDEINEAVTTKIEEGNTLQTVEDIEVGNTSSPVIEIDSNFSAITHVSTDLMGSHNGMEINEE